MSKIKVSVIMPSLNVYKYIKECISSVQSQTLEDIEIVCVDAGSTDGTYEVLEECARNDERIKVITSDIKSYGYQMNLGIKEAKGDYIGIVETDDYIEPNFFEILYNKAVENNLDCIKENHSIFTGDDKEYHKEHQSILPDKNCNLFEKILLENEYEEKFAGSLYTWAGIYKRSFLEKFNIVHNETLGASFQDNGFWFQTMVYARKMMFIDEAGYNLRRDNPNSSFFNKDKTHCIRDEYDFINFKLNENIDYFNGKVYGKKTLIEYLLNMSFYKRFTNYIGAQGRVSEDNFPRLYKYMREDFIEAIEREEVSFYGKYSWIISYVISVINNETPMHYNSKNYISRTLLEKVIQARYVYIYGAGQIGNEIYGCLHRLNLDDKIKGFIVTNKEDVRDVIYENVKHPCFSIDDINIDKKDNLIIIAVGNKYMDDIKEILINRQIDNYIIGKNLFF